MTFIRYFASIDNSYAGAIALAHLDALREVTDKPIKLIGVGGAVQFSALSFSGWKRHADLIGTPIEKEYINVVCTESMRWATLYTNKIVRPSRSALEYASGCLKNILIQTETLTPGLVATVERYDITLNQENVRIAAEAKSPSDREVAYRRVNVEKLRAAVA